jgi:hypothetical protein
MEVEGARIAGPPIARLRQGRSDRCGGQHAEVHHRGFGLGAFCWAPLANDTVVLPPAFSDQQVQRTASSPPYAAGDTRRGRPQGATQLAAAGFAAETTALFLVVSAGFAVHSIGVLRHRSKSFAR